MYSIDINKVKDLQEIHWKWFWNRATKSSIKFKDAKGGFLKLSYQFFWKIFFDWDKNTINNILFATKEEMLNKIDENGLFYKKYKNCIENIVRTTSNLMLFDKEKIKQVEEFVQKTFGYVDFENGSWQVENGRSLKAKYGKNWSAKRSLWNAYIFTTKMNVDVCPYCGRQYIFTLGDGEDKKKGRPQIDHYFPEAEFPFLSCSLYNFIPSCASCNHQKSDKYNSKKKGWRNIPYPYEDFEATSKNGKNKLYDNVMFKAFYQFAKNDSGKKTEKLRYGIKLRENGAKLTGEMKNADEAFHLEDLYNMHYLELEDLFSRYRIYNKSRLKNILSVILSAQNTPFVNKLSNILFLKAIISAESCRLKKVILGLPLGNGDQQYPLKKFKEDIVKQLDLTYDKIKKGQ